MPFRVVVPVPCFNSQPRKEADVKDFLYDVIWIRFNSQPRKEADDNFYELQQLAFVFQLTASQGG